MKKKKYPATGCRAKGLEGRYANYFEIGYNAFEFILDFGQRYDGKNQPEVHTRIIVTPESARELLTVMQEAILKHQQSFK